MKTVKTFARQFSFSLMMAMTLGRGSLLCRVQSEIQV